MNEKRTLLRLPALLAAFPHRIRQRFRNCLSAVRSVPTRPSVLSPHHYVTLANIAEGQHLASQGISYKSDVVITERFLLAKRGASADSIDLCGAANVPIGLITDESAAIGDYVNVAQFNSDLTLKMVASGAIAQDALLEPAANGRVQTLGVGAGTHYVVGCARQAAANAGDVIEVMPSFFIRFI